ncbi:Thiamine phosphate phosphatase-like protein [Thalictrum thalictroides]|uniref:Thiamine phosphate phosphatase-like protein n=1 Tax=Thalictrum thalictroides TaxID=46969 RepID=A0A7J6W5A1_THATH|nr:Thiamine phosphate phosphatase-like protein [Thalictrum thalictroides]
MELKAVGDVEDIDPNRRFGHELWPLDAIDPKKASFPCCLVWAPLPVVSWLAPFIGHVGICREDGSILNFSGSNFVNVNDFAFGAVARYLELDREKCCFPPSLSTHTCKIAYRHMERGVAMTWDNALNTTMHHFEHKSYNLFTCNCHSYVANCMNMLCYGGCLNWNVVNVAALIILKGHWVDNMSVDTMLTELHSQGITIEDIADTLKRAPIHHKAISAIKSAYALGCDLRIVSDANVFFIETILKHHGLIDCFSEINTNPSVVDEVGRLRVLPYHDFNICPHGCDLCPPNMCKGLVIERIKASVFADVRKRFIYLGDGKNDFCPSTKLREEDYVMPRKNYPVWDLICSNPLLVKADLHEWSNWDDQERILLHLINTIIFGDVIPSSIIASDCKFQTIPISNQDPLQHVVPVPHITC